MVLKEFGIWDAYGMYLKGMVYKVRNNGSYSYGNGNILGDMFLFMASLAGWFLISGLSHIFDNLNGALALIFQIIGKHFIQIMIMH